MAQLVSPLSSGGPTGSSSIGPATSKSVAGPRPRSFVTAAIDAFPGDFTLTDPERICPGVSRDMVRRVLMDLRRSGKVTCFDRGPEPPGGKGEW